MVNIFDEPQKYRSMLNDIEWISPSKTKRISGKSLICVFFTSYCVVGCPFCFFKSPLPQKRGDFRERKDYAFDKERLERFIKFANDANVGYLQISGGGEPFLELDCIIECLKRVRTDRIILITSGFWANKREMAIRTLDKLFDARNENPSNPRLSVRVSVSSDHSIRLGDEYIKNLVELFEEKYKEEDKFTLQLKCFEGDDFLKKSLDKWFPGYIKREVGSNESDDKKIIKIIPWKYIVELSSGYSFVVGKSRIFIPTLRPDLTKMARVEKGIEIFDIDTLESQDDYPSIVKNSDGNIGFDWIIEYNGNVCTWQNRIPDNLFNIDCDSCAEVTRGTLKDLVSYSYIDKGSSYRDRVIGEVSKKTIALMKAVNIRDYAGTIAFYDEKIRLYYNIRVIQDYLNQGVINPNVIGILPHELSEVIMQSKDSLIELYKKGKSSVVTQELRDCHTIDEMHDFMELINLNHFELLENDVEVMRAACKELPNVVVKDTREKDIDRRLTERMMVRKKARGELTNMHFYLFRHGETNWNVEGRIKGQLDGIQTKFTEKGVEQIKRVAERLVKADIQAIFSSDLYRTVETTKMLSEYLHKPVYYSKNFRGLNMGDFQGQLMKDFLANESVRQAFVDYNYVIPGGESINQLLERFCGGLKYICEQYTYDRVLIIAHGAAISNVFSYINKSPYIDIDYCELTTDGESFYALSSGQYADL